MKTDKKNYDAVKFMRQQRDALSKKLIKMNKKEILDYFSKSNKDKAVKPGM